MDTDLEKRMHSVLHSREELEAISAQLQQQNQLLQEQVALLRQQVNQVQVLQDCRTPRRQTKKRHGQQLINLAL